LTGNDYSPKNIFRPSSLSFAELATPLWDCLPRQQLPASISSNFTPGLLFIG